jgi:hypothetical protein
LKIKKGEVVITISPSNWEKFKLAGWKRVQDPKREKIKEYNERAKQKRLAKGGSE